MNGLDQLKERARRDFAAANLSEAEWPVFWIGYMSAIKRFGGK